MRLSLHTDYALRTLVYIASHGKRTQIQDIANFYKISRDHLAKVVRRLSQEGYVRTVRGVGGGIELAREPAEINLEDVIVRFEGPLHLLDCVAVDGVCLIQSGCKLRNVLSEAEQIQRDYLSKFSLEDLIPPDKKLVDLKADVTG